MKKLQLIVLLALFLITISVCPGCNGGSLELTQEQCKSKEKIEESQDRESHQDGKIGEKPEQEKENDKGVTEGAIYLDLSSSMKGYINDSSDGSIRIPFTLLQHALHNVLQTSFHHVEITRPRFQGFSRTIKKLDVPMKYFAIPVGDTQPRSRFNGVETNIVSVLAQASGSDSTLSVIITDGLQDVSGMSGRLAPGFDRPEFIQAICRETVKKEFGVWLVGVMNHFQGLYYNIIPNRNGEINQGIDVDGMRPIYFWITCKDKEKGREFVSYFYDNLTRLAQSNYHQEDTVQAIEMAPGIKPDLSLPEPLIDGFEIDDDLYDRITRVTIWEVPEAFKNYDNIKVARMDYPTSGGGDIIAIIKGRLSFDTQSYPWNSLPSSMWQMAVTQEGEFPLAIADKIDGIKYYGKDQQTLRFAFLKFSSDSLNVFDDKERTVELPVSLYADIDRGLDGSWIKNWSTVIDTEARHIEGKTLYLYDVVSNVIKHTMEEKKVKGCLHLSLVKRD